MKKQLLYHDAPFLLYISGSSVLCTVGAGTAGSVVAARLTENPEVKVLLVEAGDDHKAWPLTDVPGMAAQWCGSPITWDDFTVPQKHACLGMKDNVRTSYFNQQHTSY